MISLRGRKATDTFDELIRTRVDPYGQRHEMMVLHERWLKNMAYFSGKHHFYSENGTLLDASWDIPEHKVLYKVNLVRVAVMRACAMILNSHAKFAIAPDSTTIRAREIAEVSKRVWENHIRPVTGYDDGVSLLATMWAMLCGSGIIKVYWDRLAGEPDRFYWDSKATKAVIPEVLLDASLKLQKERDGEFEDLFAGEIALDNVNPFSFRHDWSSRDKGTAGCQWVAEHHRVDIDRFAERMGVDTADIAPDGEGRGVANYEEAIAFMSSNDFASSYGWMDPQDKKGKRVIVTEMWERPSAHHKKGLHLVFAGGKTWNKKTDNPYIGDKSGLLHLPYVKQDWAPHPGRFWGFSAVEDMTSPQAQLNEARGSLASFLRVHGSPATFVGSNSGIDPNEVTIQPGGTYVVSETSKGVTYGAVPHLPPEVANFGGTCEDDLMKIASQSDVDGSKLPGQMRSGEAIRLMNEERHVALSIPSRMQVTATRDVGRMGLKLGQMFYSEQRKMKYVGEDGQFIVKFFTGADLNNDLVMLGEPSVMDTTAARRAEVLDAVQVGALQPQMNPEHQRLVTKALHFGSSDEAISVLLQAEKNQEFEILQMIEDPLKYGDQGYPVMDWEDHQAEIDVLRRFMYSEQFRALPNRTKSVIVLHWQQHAEKLQAQEVQAMQMMAAQKGAPGEKGMASQPKR